MTCGVYTITNTVNGRLYVGSSNNIEYRWKQHICDLKERRHFNLYLQRAWSKYGAGSFSFEVILETQQDSLLDMENFYIEVYRNKSYNLCDRAGKPPPRTKSTYIRTEEIKKAASERAKGMRHSEEAKKKMSKAKKGIRHTEEWKKENSRRHKGRRVTEETRQKMSVVHKTRTRTPMSQEARKARAEIAKKQWQDPGFREKMMRARGKG